MKIQQIIISLLITTVFMASCSKKKLDKELSGKWERVHTEDVDYNGPKEYWTFDNGTITITQDNGGTITTIDEGQYVLKMKIEYKELIAKGFGETIKTASYDYRNEFYNTKWVIDRVEKNTLGMYSDKDDNFFYYDFVKVD